MSGNSGMGGVERVTTQLANTLSSKEYEVSLIDFSGVNTYFYSPSATIELPKCIRQRNLKRKLLNKLNGKFKNYNLSNYNLYKEQTDDLIRYLKEEPKDILILSEGILTSLIPVIKRKVPNIKIIAWQHNEYEIYIGNYYKNFKDEYIRGLQEADRVICLTKNDLIKFKVLNEKCEYIYNPLTLDVTKTSELSFNNILFVGRFKIKQKGLDYLIDISEVIPSDWKMLVAGDGPDKKEFMQLIKQKGLSDKILLEGTLKPNELENFYNQGSIFISTSRWEGFGLVITEAMASGLPVISFENNGPNEILGDSKYGILIEKGNIGKFKEELTKMINDRSRLILFSKKSLERAEIFRPEFVYEKWVEQFRLLN